MCSRLLDRVKEMHRESEAVVCHTVQTGGRYINLLIKINESGFGVSNQIHKPCRASR